MRMEPCRFYFLTFLGKRESREWVHWTQKFGVLAPGPRFIDYARKPQAFKPGDEWHLFEAKPGETWRSGANSGMIWLWPDI